MRCLSYLIGPASLELLSAYSGMPARTADQDAFFAQKAEAFPFVKNWDAIGTASTIRMSRALKATCPTGTRPGTASRTFQTLMQQKGLDLDKEIAKVAADLQVIFDKAAK